ncbi:hypothetical protein [Streptomyces sp. NPDC001980]|uniref:hypothetical protein n=1 Tax=Streptomyces sp. NPDC001980 TaxID=3157126 RepID=UPI003326FCF1
MTSPSPDPLQLDAGQVRNAADFHEAYAHFVMGNVEAEDGDAEAALIEAASAYRLAGQWRLLVDRKGGIALLLRAASLYSRAGLMYGAYLEASLAPVRVRDRRDAWTAQLLRTAGRPQSAAGPAFEELRSDRFLGHVQQQTYLLLACAALTAPRSEQAAELRSFATRSPHRDGVVPMGSMGMPVRTFWGLALNMLSPDDGPAARTYADTLTGLSRTYARTVDLAMANTLTWFNGAAPIDVADLDVIGTMAMGVRHFGRARMQDLLDTTELPAVALVPLDLGKEMVPPDDPDLDRPTRRPTTDVADQLRDPWDRDLDPDTRDDLGGAPDTTDLNDRNNPRRPDEPDGPDGGLDL